MNLSVEFRKYLFLTGHVILVLGLVSSKALISIGSVVLILSAFWSLRFRDQLFPDAPRQAKGFMLLFLIPLVSGLWSSQSGPWLDAMLNKLMLPALALSYYWAPQLKKRDLVCLSLIHIILVALASLYSIIIYVVHPESAHSEYLQAKTLQVLLSNDHLHFSLLVFITLVFILFDWEMIKSSSSTRTLRWVKLIGIWFIIYLHILGAKSGLIMLYLGALSYLLKEISWSLRSLYRLIIIPILALILVLAYLLFPTFKNRVHYTLFDFNQYAHGSFINGLTDGARVLSWKAGVDIIKAHPLLGVGYGDLDATFVQWHSQHSANLDRYNWLQPSNEWLLHWSGSGLFGMLLFTVALAWIFWYSNRRSSRLFNILFFAQIGMCWYEVNLNSQIGITLFVWSISWIQWNRIGLKQVPI